MIHNNINDASCPQLFFHKSGRAWSESQFLDQDFLRV